MRRLSSTTTIEAKGSLGLSDTKMGLSKTFTASKSGSSREEDYVAGIDDNFLFDAK